MRHLRTFLVEERSPRLFTFPAVAVRAQPDPVQNAILPAPNLRYAVVQVDVHRSQFSRIAVGIGAPSRLVAPKRRPKLGVGHILNVSSPRRIFPHPHGVVIEEFHDSRF